MTFSRKAPAAVYAEESPRLPALFALALTLLVAALLAYWIVQVNRQGRRDTNLAAYRQLVQAMQADATEVDAILRNDAEALSGLAANRKRVATLIVPEVVIVDEPKPAEPAGAKAFEAEITGIYWNPSQPLVGIGGETYRVGERVDGYEIVRIGKSKVQLQSEDGTLVIKDMDDDVRKFK